MPYCGVDGCKNRSATSSLKKDGVTFHVFPKDSEISLAWMKACNRGLTWRPTATSTVCSRHFARDQFQQLPNQRRLLVPGAVPTTNLPGGGCLDSKESDSKTDNFMTKQDVARIMDNTARKVKEKVGEKNKTIHRLQSKILYLKKRVHRLQDVVKNEGIKREKPESTIKMITRKLIARCALKDRTIHNLQTACANLKKKMEGAAQVKASAGPVTLTKMEDQENEVIDLLPKKK